MRLGIAIRSGGGGGDKKKKKQPNKTPGVAHAFCAHGVLNSEASVDGGRKMAAVILERLGKIS